MLQGAGASPPRRVDDRHQFGHHDDARGVRGPMVRSGVRCGSCRRARSSARRASAGRADPGTGARMRGRLSGDAGRRSEECGPVARGCGPSRERAMRRRNVRKRDATQYAMTGRDAASRIADEESRRRPLRAVLALPFDACRTRSGVFHRQMIRSRAHIHSGAPLGLPRAGRHEGRQGSRHGSRRADWHAGGHARRADRGLPGSYSRGKGAR